MCEFLFAVSVYKKLKSRIKCLCSRIVQLCESARQFAQLAHRFCDRVQLLPARERQWGSWFRNRGGLAFGTNSHPGNRQGTSGTARTILLPSFFRRSLALSLQMTHYCSRTMSCCSAKRLCVLISSLPYRKLLARLCSQW